MLWRVAQRVVPAMDGSIHPDRHAIVGLPRSGLDDQPEGTEVAANSAARHSLRFARHEFERKTWSAKVRSCGLDWRFIPSLAVSLPVQAAHPIHLQR